MDLIMLAVAEKPTQIQLQIVVVATEELLFNGKQEVVRTSLVQDQQKLVTHSPDGQLMQMELALPINQMPH
jgi:hypothetical protein